MKSLVEEAEHVSNQLDKARHVMGVFYFYLADRTHDAAIDGAAIVVQEMLEGVAESLGGLETMLRERQGHEQELLKDRLVEIHKPAIAAKFARRKRGSR